MGFEGQKYTIVDKLEITLSLNKPENPTLSDAFKQKFIEKFAKNTNTKHFDRKGNTDRNPRFTATFTEANLANKAKVEQRWWNLKKSSSSASGNTQCMRYNLILLPEKSEHLLNKSLPLTGNRNRRSQKRSIKLLN